MNPLPRSTDVFVAGGGPAGLAAAIAARARGFDVVVADGAVPPIDKACGEGIMPDGIAAARALGLDLTESGAYPFRGVRFCEDGTRVEADFPVERGLGLRRTALHALMSDRAAAAGVRVAWGARVSHIANEGVVVDGPGGGFVRARWIVGADGGRSAVRRWAGLDGCRRQSLRFGFRRHYHTAPWSEFMELHWGERCQLYVTPVAPGEICVVAISRDPRLRLDDALPLFPEVAHRLDNAKLATPERGGVSASLSLKSVCRGNVALVGDASGSVDAITGEGICLLFQHALALAGALAAGDLALYQAEHRRIGRRPQFMSDLMLLLERPKGLRHRAIRAMASDPRLFAQMLAMHVGGISIRDFLTNGLTLGRRMLTV
jgi:flavin-dependent dehydrogenase